MSLSIEQYLAERDKVLGDIIPQISLPTFNNQMSVFHDLMGCIVEQQIHYRSTKKTFAKMLQEAGIKELSLDNFAQFEEKSLPTVKLSTRKYETMERVLEFFSEQTLNWQAMDEATTREALGSIKGVGKWTIDMILMYTLAKPDVFPVDDYHLKQLMVQHYKLNPKTKLAAQMKSVAEEWAPYRSFGVKYLLAYKEFLKKK